MYFGKSETEKKYGTLSDNRCGWRVQFDALLRTYQEAPYFLSIHYRSNHQPFTFFTATELYSSSGDELSSVQALEGSRQFWVSYILDAAIDHLGGLTAREHFLYGW